MTNFRGSQAFGIGRWGEDEVRDWLREQGKFVIPVNTIEIGGAPQALGLMKNMTLPDLNVIGAGCGEWWEVKTKRKPAWNQHRRKHVHGVGKRVWHQYLEVEAESGWPGYLAIITQESPHQLVAASFARLSKVLMPHQGSWDVFGEEMVWFDRDDFDVLLDGPQWRTPSPPILDIAVVHPWSEPPPPEWQQLSFEHLNVPS